MLSCVQHLHWNDIGVTYLIRHFLSACLVGSLWLTLKNVKAVYITYSVELLWISIDLQILAGKYIQSMYKESILSDFLNLRLHMMWSAVSSIYHLDLILRKTNYYMFINIIDAFLFVNSTKQREMASVNNILDPLCYFRKQNRSVFIWHSCPVFDAILLKSIICLFSLCILCNEDLSASAF